MSCERDFPRKIAPSSRSSSNRKEEEKPRLYSIFFFNTFRPNRSLAIPSSKAINTTGKGEILLLLFYCLYFLLFYIHLLHLHLHLLSDQSREWKKHFLLKAKMFREVFHSTKNWKRRQKSRKRGRGRRRKSRGEKKEELERMGWRPREEENEETRLTSPPFQARLYS